MVEQTFLLPQVKQSVITSNKHDTFDLPDGLPNHLILKILGNQEISGKSQNRQNYNIRSAPPSNNETPPNIQSPPPQRAAQHKNRNPPQIPPNEHSHTLPAPSPHNQNIPITRRHPPTANVSPFLKKQYENIGESHTRGGKNSRRTALIYSHQWIEQGGRKETFPSFLPLDQSRYQAHIQPSPIYTYHTSDATEGVHYDRTALDSREKTCPFYRNTKMKLSIQLSLILTFGQLQKNVITCSFPRPAKIINSESFKFIRNVVCSSLVYLCLSLESATGGVLKKDVLKIFSKIPVLESFLIKFQA